MEMESEKRFLLSSEPFAKERMASIQETLREMKHKYPEVLSFCTFGSMVKGTAHEKSDIDGYLFVDADQAAQRHPEESIINMTPKEEYTKHRKEISLQAYFRPDIRREYEKLLRDSLQQKFDLYDEQVRHIRVLPINREIIDQHVQELEPWATGRADHVVWPSPNIFAMFHLAIGSGVRPYRRYLLERLGTMGESGERIWQEIIRNVEMLEQNFQENTGKRYPKSLEDAQKLYGKTDLTK